MTLTHCFRLVIEHFGIFLVRLYSETACHIFVYFQTCQHLNSWETPWRPMDRSMASHKTTQKLHGYNGGHSSPLGAWTRASSWSWWPLDRFGSCHHFRHRFRGRLHDRLSRLVRNLFRLGHLPEMLPLQLPADFEVEMLTGFHPSRPWLLPWRPR